MVFYRSERKTKEDGEGILCKVLRVVDKKRDQYEIEDVEDEEHKPKVVMRSELQLIPPSNEGLSELTSKQPVLAMYPGTTTFYKADVVAVKGKDIRPGEVRLLFEDEEEQNKSMPVERRYILTDV